MAEAAPLMKCFVLGSTTLAMQELMFFQNKTPTEFLTELMKIINSQERRHCKLLSTTMLHACLIQAAVSVQTEPAHPQGCAWLETGHTRHHLHVLPPLC